MRLSVAGGTASVDVVLNGSTTVPMLVDSGASVVTLTAEVGKELGLKPQPGDPEVEFTIADGTTLKARVMTLASVRVGAFAVNDVACPVLPASAKGAECLLGGSFLGRFVVRMDLASGQMMLTPRDPQAQERADRAAVPTKRPVTAESPAAPRKLAAPAVLTIEAAIDGTDVVKVTPAGLTWEHREWGWPADVRVNGIPWDPKATKMLATNEALAFLKSIDLSTARTSKKSGRGSVAMEITEDGLEVHFNDPQGGADRYRIEISLKSGSDS